MATTKMMASGPRPNTSSTNTPPHRISIRYLFSNNMFCFHLFQHVWRPVVWAQIITRSYLSSFRSPCTCSHYGWLYHYFHIISNEATERKRLNTHTYRRTDRQRSRVITFASLCFKYLLLCVFKYALKHVYY